MTENEIINIVVKHINIKKNNIKLNSKIEDLPGWDSLNLFNIVMDIERKSKKKLNINKFLKIKTFKEFIELIEKK